MPKHASANCLFESHISPDHLQDDMHSEDDVELVDQISSKKRKRGIRGRKKASSKYTRDDGSEAVQEELGGQRFPHFDLMPQKRFGA